MRKSQTRAAKTQGSEKSRGLAESAQCTLRVIVFDISINEILGVNERKVIFEIVTAAALTLCALQ